MPPKRSNNGVSYEKEINKPCEKFDVDPDLPRSTSVFKTKILSRSDIAAIRRERRSDPDRSTTESKELADKLNRDMSFVLITTRKRE